MINNFWENQYVVSLSHHTNQNSTIANDFFSNITSDFRDIIDKSNSFFEFGCGTGELCEILKQKTDKVVGVDISNSAIAFAKANYKSEYFVYDIKDEFTFGYFDTIITSNVLEHFIDPNIVLDKLLNYCKHCIVIVPYNQQILDTHVYNTDVDIGGGEGGGGHWFRFDENTFNNYGVVSFFIFQTNGWTTSTNGESPRQIAYLIKGNQ